MERRRAKTTVLISLEDATVRWSRPIAAVTVL